MNIRIKHIVSALALGLCLVGCSKDPDVPIYEEMDFHRCLTPVNAKFTPQYVTVSVDFTTFPDAEDYELEAYSTEIVDGIEPDQDYLLYKARFTADDLPYSFVGPEFTTCYIRLRARNDSKEKEPSHWVKGSAKTQENPEITCIAPSDAKTGITNLFKKVTFNWVPAGNVEKYEVEFYDTGIPSTGDPDPAHLKGSFNILPAQLDPVNPLTIEIPKGDESNDYYRGKYYFRVRGVNETRGLVPSRWITGSFTIDHYWWRGDTWTNAFDYGLAMDAYHQTAYTVADIEALGVPVGDEVPRGASIHFDGVAYGPLTTFQGDRFSLKPCTNWDKTTYTNYFPREQFQMIEVAEPGILSFIPRIPDASQLPEIVVGILILKSGQDPTFKYVYQQTLTVGNSATITTGPDEANRVSITIERDEVYGALEASKVYVFANKYPMDMYPLRWTKHGNTELQ